MPTTSLGLRYPALADTPDVPRDIQNLATDTNTVLIGEPWRVVGAAGQPAYGIETLESIPWVGSARFCLIAGFVHLRGHIDIDGQSSQPMPPAFFLPTSYRPPVEHFFYQWKGSEANGVVVRIDPNGSVQIQGAPGYARLDGISFRTT